MTENNWIKVNGILYPGVKQETQSSNIVVVLFPGFSLPMSDRDYFMSRIAKEIKDFATVYQFDIRGHGDSNVDIERLTVSMIREDYTNILNWLREKTNNKIYCIGRGIAPILFMEAAKTSQCVVDGVIGLNSYMIAPKYLKKLFKQIKEKEYYVSLEEFENNTVFKSMLRAMGTDLEYIMAEKLPREFFVQLEKLKPDDIFQNFNNKKILIYPMNDKNYTPDIIKGEEINIYQKIDWREDAMLPFNSFWQSNVINLIKNILWTWSKEND